jgi:ribonuclease HI
VKIEVYSDGSGMTKKTPAGYGFVVCRDNIKVYEGSGHIEFGTNNDAELMAAISGLDSLNDYFKANDIGLLEEVTLVSDSQIILNWASGRNAFKQEEKMDKYLKLRLLMGQFNAKTRWVKGHNGDVNQERCDKLANAARKKEILS